jgi:hypothetical protein
VVITTVSVKINGSCHAAPIIRWFITYSSEILTTLIIRSEAQIELCKSDGAVWNGVSRPGLRMDELETLTLTEAGTYIEGRCNRLRDMEIT